MQMTESDCVYSQSNKSSLTDLNISSSLVCHLHNKLTLAALCRIQQVVQNVYSES